MHTWPQHGDQVVQFPASTPSAWEQSRGLQDVWPTSSNSTRESIRHLGL